MIISMRADKLTTGMFIDLSKSWIENPFWKTQFEITTDEQIKMLIEAGIKVVNVDSSRSKVDFKGLKDIDIQSSEKITLVSKPLRDVAVEQAGVVNGEKSDPLFLPEDEDREIPEKWEPEKFIEPEILRAVDDNRLAPDKRAKALYIFSLRIMKNIFDNPHPEIIKGAKKGFTQITNIILAEDTTASKLVKLVSHDSFTYTHSVNVGLKSILLAKSLYGNTKKHDIFALATGFFLHDIGKIRISPKILYKEGKLTPKEYELMKTHPYEGYKILKSLKELSNETWIIAMQHHERDDGEGYPCALKSSDIHPYSKICCIADVYDALTAKRTYKKQKTAVEALTIMKNEMLDHFNVELFGKFLLLFKQK